MKRKISFVQTFEKMEHLITLLLLILLQAVLGFDNLLYISLESKKAPSESQSKVRMIGIVIAIALRIALLFALTSLAPYIQESIIEISSTFVDAHFNIDSIITLAGGGFIIYTAIKEIFHMIGVEHHDENNEKAEKTSINQIIFWIVVMNLVFSFDSILSAMALTDNFWVMAGAIVVSGILMVWLSDKVSEFLKKNRLYEILGLFILFIVGIMLLTEGGHKAHLSFFGNEITPMSKTTFYFVIGTLVIVDIIQGKFQKKMLKK